MPALMLARKGHRTKHRGYGHRAVNFAFNHKMRIPIFLRRKIKMKNGKKTIGELGEMLVKKYNQKTVGKENLTLEGAKEILAICAQSIIGSKTDYLDVKLVQHWSDYTNAKDSELLFGYQLVFAPSHPISKLTGNGKKTSINDTIFIARLDGKQFTVKPWNDAGLGGELECRIRDIVGNAGWKFAVLLETYETFVDFVHSNGIHMPDIRRIAEIFEYHGIAKVEILPGANLKKIEQTAYNLIPAVKLQKMLLGETPAPAGIDPAQLAYLKWRKVFYVHEADSKEQAENKKKVDFATVTSSIVLNRVRIRLSDSGKEIEMPYKEAAKSVFLLERVAKERVLASAC